ncbi:hypothetical protein KC19_2G168300 [Ceratodon purpureus]|uniref:Uncharacterized protein n=1 Tax=Ceratodon purpureus TaxID=3225 RepID=A0A8T0IUT6_CERPU|nr:hypothetical protein KC19_2G168300 [Ceratodon purpureus]
MSTTTLEHQPNNILTPMFTRAQNYNYTVSCTKTTNRNAPYCTRKLSTKQLSSDCNSRLPVLAIRAAHSPRIHITTQRNAPKSTTTTNSINQSNKQRIQQTINQSHPLQTLPAVILLPKPHNQTSKFTATNPPKNSTSISHSNSRPMKQKTN